MKNLLFSCFLTDICQKEHPMHCPDERLPRRIRLLSLQLSNCGFVLSTIIVLRHCKY